MSNAEPEVIDNDPVPDELLDGEAVVEAGAYEGAWALKVCQARPDCTVYAYEPASRAYKMAREKLNGHNVILRNVALSKQNGTAMLCDRDRDGANTFDHNPEHKAGESVAVVDAAEALGTLGEIALAHLNAEGGEVEILERLIETGLIGRIKMLLVQWHPYDDEMRGRISRVVEGLQQTHDFERRDCWGCWKRRAERKDG